MAWHTKFFLKAPSNRGFFYGTDFLVRYVDMAHKRLYRSETNKVLAGICGGLGEYFDVDPTVLRLLWLLIVIFTGVFPGIIAYILAIFIIPVRPGAHAARDTHTGSQHNPDAA